MKKVVSMLLVAVLLVGCVFALASCGKRLSGKYELDAVVASKTYEFKGKNVTITYEAFGQDATIEGTYSIAENDEGDLEITFTFADDEEGADEYEGTFKFEEGDGYIKIAGVKYKKAD